MRYSRRHGSSYFWSFDKRCSFQYRGRENKIGTLEERINGCFERSMNGKKLPVESKGV